MIIPAILRCYKRGNSNKALILVPSGSVSQPTACQTFKPMRPRPFIFFSCGDQTTGIQLAPPMTHLVQKVDGALLHQTTSGQSAGWNPLSFFLFVPCDLHHWESLFLLQISGFIHDKDSNRGILVPQLEVTCRDEYWRIPAEDTYFNGTTPVEWDSWQNLRLCIWRASYPPSPLSLYY